MTAIEQPGLGEVVHELFVFRGSLFWVPCSGFLVLGSLFLVIGYWFLVEEGQRGLGAERR